MPDLLRLFETPLIIGAAEGACTANAGLRTMLDDIRQARQRIAPHVRRTPLVQADALSAPVTEAELWLKLALHEMEAATAAIGEDRLQQQSQGYVVPDTFTHGTSAQRVAAFRQGMDAGQVADCNCAELPKVG